ncbi:MAG: peptidyl-prolyl cis-trans isomerase [Phycisphaeraceae bacterium]|nr:peptidyl-prolyl cis-trans isomerase [Phycisphaeraceae bacterium]
MFSVQMLAVVSMFSLNAFAQEKSAKAIWVEFQTSQGDITIKLFPDKAPKTVKNFLTYVDEGFYSDTIFHRVMPNFMIQGGGMTADMKEKRTHAPVTNEADNGLSNKLGSIAMARTGNPHSATAQFFINVKNNASLDHQSKLNGRSWGYCVFGQVVKGMNVVNDIRKVRTGQHGHHSDVPVKTVLIKKAMRVKK